jgi:predicted ATPase
MLSVLEEMPGGPQTADQPTAVEATELPLHNLPAQSTPFVGRAQELAEIVRRLQDPACHLLTLIGPGGIGKTRLALAVAEAILALRGPLSEATPQLRASDPTANSQQPEFADGVFFVAVQPVSTASGLIAAIAEALGFRFYSDVPPDQQLFRFLREKRLLLVLDNMEHLPEGATVVAELLRKAPGVKVLATSRRPLQVRDEWFHPLAGMTLPAASLRAASPLRTPPPIASGPSDAVQFFVQSARRVQPEFDAAAEQAQIVRICRLVDGVPLALEMAATWLKTLTCQQIADEIERSLAFLTAQQQTIPIRHRSMVAVLEQSWQLLDDEERAVLKRLCVFRGGFTQAAAQEVADASLPILEILIEKALVWVTPTGRYHMHELLRQFAQEKGAAEDDAETITRTYHAAYYLRLLELRAPLLLGKARRIALDEIGQELDNVRTAWLWAAQQNNRALLNPVIDPLYHFYQIQSRYQEGYELFAQTAALLQSTPAADADPASAIVPVRVMARGAAFSHFLCEFETAGVQLQESLARAQALNQPGEVAFALNFLGQLAMWRGDKGAAKRHLEQSLAISRAIGDKSGAASALEKLANLIHATFGEYVECKALAQESLALSRELGRPDWIAYALDTLGFVTFCLGEYTDAEAYYRESLALFETIGDHYGVAMAQGGLGLVLWAMWGGQSVEATAFFEKSLAICRAIGHQGQVAGRLSGLARIANDLGDYAQAQRLAEEGLAIARELGSPVYLSHILYCLGETAYRTGDLPASRRYLLEALQLTSETGLLAYLSIALFHYAVLLIEESADAPADATPQRAQALALLTLVQSHPATWHLFRERAAQQAATLEAQLPPEIVAKAKAHGAQLLPDQAVMEILSQPEAVGVAPVGTVGQGS